MTLSSKEHALPRDVTRALRRLLKMLPTAPAEVQALVHPAEGDDESAGAARLETISNWLYVSWYTSPNDPEEPPVLVPGRENLASALRACLSASTRWESGWVAIRTTPTGICLAGRGKKSLELRPGEYVNLARPGMPVAPGDHIAVSEMIEWIDERSRFWCVRSWIDEPHRPIVRLYFSARADQVGYVLTEVTKTLDDLKLPYSLKCPSSAAVYTRVDSLIAYIEAGSWPRASREINALAKRIREHTRDATPPLTKKIGQGVAFAEDTGEGESFGENRCRALAPAVLALLQGPQYSPVEGLDRLSNSLRAAGIDPVHPWLAGSSPS